MIKPGVVAMYADASVMLQDTPSLLRFNFVSRTIVDGLSLELITYFLITKNLPRYCISTRDFRASFKEKPLLWFDMVRKLSLIHAGTCVLGVVNNVCGAWQTTMLNYLLELAVLVRHSQPQNSTWNQKGCSRSYHVICCHLWEEGGAAR